MRVWYLTETGDQLVQVQPDRLVHNWRRTSLEEPYPRYETLRPAFAAEAELLLEFLSEAGLPAPHIAQAEVTYINPIPMSTLGQPPDLGRVLAPWSGVYSDGFLPLAEDVGFNVRYRIPDSSSGQPVGRLNVVGNPALQPGAPGAEPEEVFMLQLFARGGPLGSGGLDGAIAFLDLGHDWVVRGFTSLTTEVMHAEWGRVKE
jgi:uncharacterized protein (TIGR04255 family)